MLGVVLSSHITHPAVNKGANVETPDAIFRVPRFHGSDDCGDVCRRVPVGSRHSLWGASVLSLVDPGSRFLVHDRSRPRGLLSLESVVADHDNSETLRTGLEEFDQAAQRIGKCAARWENVAADTRQQSRDFQSMMSLLNRRGAEGESSSTQLRGLLAGLGSTLHTHLSQIERGAAEIEQYTKAITAGSETQGHAVIKTTAYVEQLSSTIDHVVHQRRVGPDRNPADR